MLGAVNGSPGAVKGFDSRKSEAEAPQGKSLSSARCYHTQMNIGQLLFQTQAELVPTAKTALVGKLTDKLRSTLCPSRSII